MNWEHEEILALVQAKKVKQKIDGKSGQLAQI
jgi:hypothetical protein